MKSFLQTQDWLDFQKYVGRKTWRFDDGKIKANIIRHDLPFRKNYLYIPHGPEISFSEIQSGLKNEVEIFLKYLKEIGKENNSIFVKMEPLEDVVTEVIHRKSLRHSKKSIQPTISFHAQWLVTLIFVAACTKWNAPKTAKSEKNEPQRILKIMVYL